jgi:hypothetical protein
LPAELTLALSEPADIRARDEILARHSNQTAEDFC